MDKKLLLSKSLEKIMVELLPQLKEIVRNNTSPEISIKSDTSPLTQLDLAINDFLEESLPNYSDASFYTEEKSRNWKFPLFAIDPVDGTKEFIKQRPEWAVSVAYLENECWQGEGWIFNPMTTEIYSSSQKRIRDNFNILEGEVSHTEWDANLYNSYHHSRVSLKPMGSIAYKLGRLSHGQSDFVVSLKPKNIWDIAAGTLLCKTQGFKFYSEGLEVKDVRQSYNPPLIWCLEKDSSLLLNLFSKQKDTDL